MQIVDRELLELAAKAAGLDLTYCPAWSCMAKKLADLDGEYFDSKTCWNPLTYDGDALRLAVNLRISVSIGKDVVEAYIGESDGKLEASKSTILSATRRAIVRAAAEIGRQMQNGGAA